MKQMQMTRAQAQDNSIYNYNAERERQRKLLTEKLYNRTQAQIQEEEMLIIHLRKMELNYKRSALERERILRLLNAGEYGHHPLEESEDDANLQKVNVIFSEGIIS
jgi:glucan phosphorylase